MRKTCASSMTVGSVCLEICDQRKIVNATTVDHKNMLRKTQTLILILLRQWTWVTWRNAPHRIQRNPSLVVFKKLISTRFSWTLLSTVVIQKVSPLGHSESQYLKLDYICPCCVFNSSMDFFLHFYFIFWRACTSWDWLMLTSKLSTGHKRRQS